MSNSANDDNNQAQTQNIATPVKTVPVTRSRIESIEFRELSPHYPKLNAFSHFIGLAVIFVALFMVNLLIEKINLPFMVLPMVAIAALISAIYGYYFAKSCAYFRGEFDILYKEGLWWQKQTALSFSRIQHIDITHGPLERKYNIATIKFFTAGGAASDLKIPGLPNELAESLRSEILQYAKTEYAKAEYAKPELDSDSDSSNE